MHFETYVGYKCTFRSKWDKIARQDVDVINGTLTNRKARSALQEVNKIEVHFKYLLG